MFRDGGGRLGSQGRHHGKTVIGPIGKCPAGPSGQDQGVELSRRPSAYSPPSMLAMPVRQEKGLAEGMSGWYRVTGQCPTTTHR